MAKKHVDHTVNFTKENGNTAIAEVLVSGKVDVTIKTPHNVTVINHYDGVDVMQNEMAAMNYHVI